MNSYCVQIIAVILLLLFLVHKGNAEVVLPVEPLGIEEELLKTKSKKDVVTEEKVKPIKIGKVNLQNVS